MLVLSSLVMAVVWGGGGAVPACPRECTCEVAPLRAASFVLAWMTSWGEEDLPQLHPNDVGAAGDLVSSGAAVSAGVNVDVVGLHATCALMPDANLTRLTHALPPDTMVLTVLQGGGGGVVVVEEGQLAPLAQLRALHLQGYARRRATQVSGYFPNTVEGMVAQKEAIAAAEEAEFKDGELQLLMAEDALTPLTRLQLLDLQYVRLVAGRNGAGGRLRRQVEPVASDILLDMPLPYFLSMTQQLQDVDLPPELLSLLPSVQASPDQHLEVVVLEDNEDDLVPYEVLRAKESEEGVHGVILAPFLAQTELRYLRVAHAKLDRVGGELLGGMGALHTLTLEHNNIKVLPPVMFAATPELRHLSLAHNSLLTLEAASLAGLDHLVTLDLDHNGLDQLGPASFPRLPCLAMLRLLANPLAHVFPFTFSNVNVTETLVMGSLLVAAEVHEDTFRSLSDLTTLRLENTSLTSLSRALLDGMPRLSHLTLHGYVPVIDYDTFTATPLLRSLTLSHCRLEKLSQDAFFGLRELRYLDLSHNQLVRLHPGTFDHLASLRELYLHHNRLTSLPRAIFFPLPAKLIQLHQNPWHCSCRLLQLVPTITNKVRQPGYTTCHWDEKAGTVCTVPDPVPLRYDSRVAPLCATPAFHRHHDVFYIATRRLKCSKMQWDPRFATKTIPSTTTPAPRQSFDKKNVLEIDSFNLADPAPGNREETDLPVEEEYSNWVPLTAHTSPPLEVEDLLEIAEAEMPEEAYAPLDYYEEEEEREANRGEQGEEEERDNAREEEEELDNEISVMPNVIQDAVSRGSYRERGLSQNMIRKGPAASGTRAEYLIQKRKMKATMEAGRRQLEEEILATKRRYWSRLVEQKKREKARREEQMTRQQQRKEAQLEEFLREQELYRMRVAVQESS